MRIYLIGFMSSGKTTMGRLVADSLNVPFIDTDQMIEEQTGMTISGIFSIQGEKEFREFEADVLRQSTIHDKAIIATGGGAPCFHHNMTWMNEHGITMYLSWPYELIQLNLINNISSRPLVSGLHPDGLEDQMALLFEERLPFYEMSSMTIEVEGNLEKDKITLEKACRYIW